MTDDPFGFVLFCLIVVTTPPAFCITVMAGFMLWKERK